MSYRFERGFNPMMRMSGATAVKTLIIANVAVYALMLIIKATSRGNWGAFIELFGLVPESITSRFYIWQFVTSLFLHLDLYHIFFNMLGLFFFGPELERLWGKMRFLKVYFGIGVLANLLSYIIGIHNPAPSLGASGAVYGIMAAFAALYPNVQVIVYIFPVKVKYLVMFLFLVSFLGSTGLEGGGNVSYIGHLGGIVFGVAYVMGRFRRLDDVLYNIKEKIRLWRIKRKYRNFRVVDSEVKQMWDELEDKINDDGRNKHIN